MTGWCNLRIDSFDSHGGRPGSWLVSLAGRIPFPPGAEFSLAQWVPSERRRRRVLQAVANSLCNVVIADRRYPNETRRKYPEGGRLVLDVLTRRCTLNDAAVAPMGIADRLNVWLHAQLREAGIPKDQIRGARMDIEYSCAERTYLASGRVWEMHFSLRSEISTQDRHYFGTAPACTAAVPYGIGAITMW
jgi:hypothetical protein